MNIVWIVGLKKIAGIYFMRGKLKDEDSGEEKKLKRGKWKKCTTYIPEKLGIIRQLIDNTITVLQL